MEAKKLSIRQILLALEVGESTTFPAEKLKSVRVGASEVSFTANVKFLVNAMRGDNGNYVKVTRTS